MIINWKSPINAFMAFYRWIRFVIANRSIKAANVDNDTYIKRLTTCIICPEHDPEFKQCKVCTCFVQVKAQLKTETCPLKKW
jgi:hypothetical protein